MKIQKPIGIDVNHQLCISKLHYDFSKLHQIKIQKKLLSRQQYCQKIDEKMWQSEKNQTWNEKVNIQIKASALTSFFNIHTYL